MPEPALPCSPAPEARKENTNAQPQTSTLLRRHGRHATLFQPPAAHQQRRCPIVSHAPSSLSLSLARLLARSLSNDHKKEHTAVLHPSPFIVMPCYCYCCLRLYQHLKSTSSPCPCHCHCRSLPTTLDRHGHLDRNGHRSSSCLALVGLASSRRKTPYRCRRRRRCRCCRHGRAGGPIP